MGRPGPNVDLSDVTLFGTPLGLAQELGGVRLHDPDAEGPTDVVDEANGRPLLARVEDLQNPAVRAVVDGDVY